MLKVTLVGMWLTAMAACAIDQSGETEHNSQQSVAEISEVAATSSGTTATAGVWVLDSTENCFDYYLQKCTASVPSPQCPTASAGQACSPLGSFCLRVVSSSSFRVLSCE
jgi:hypothetical protein